MVDSHCHLYFPEFDQDRDEVIKRARKTGVSFFVQVGASLEDSRKAVDLANRHDDMAASVGMHPHEAEKYLAACHCEPRRGVAIPEIALSSRKSGTPRNDSKHRKKMDAEIAELKRLALDNKKVKAIGECGLDFGKTGEIGDDEKKAQIALFEAQVALAKELELPLIIHCRNAHKETAKMIQDTRFLARGECAFGAKFHDIVIHCFTGSWLDAKRYLDLGCFISFSGIVTFKKAESIQEAVRKVPLNRMLVETDAPYLAPTPHRGKRNEPAFVKNIIQAIADLRGVSFAEIEMATDQNAGKIFSK